MPEKSKARRPVVADSPADLPDTLAHSLQVRVSSALLANLKTIAQAEGRKVASMARVLIEQGIVRRAALASPRRDRRARADA